MRPSKCTHRTLRLAFWPSLPLGLLDLMLDLNGHVLIKRIPTGATKTTLSIRGIAHLLAIIINRIIQVYRVRTPRTPSINNGTQTEKLEKREKWEKREKQGKQRLWPKPLWLSP